MWVRLDDGFADHPKLAALGLWGIAVQVRALCYAGRHLTDGYLPETVARLLTSDVPQADAVDMMVHAGLWEISTGGYLIHDYDQYNPSKQSVLQLRARRAKYGRRGGVAKALANAVANAQQPSSNGLPRTRTRTRTQTPTPTATPDYTVGQAEPARPPTAQNGIRHNAKAVLDFLNRKTGRQYQPVEANLRLIEARLRGGATVDQCRAIVGLKVRAWLGDATMAPYLRPATLFNATKFSQYQGELPASAFQGDADAE